MAVSAQMSIAIVSYGTRDDLSACLTKIRDEPWHEVVVVDNGSTDESGRMVRSAFPWARLIENETNRGFGAAANQALAACSTEYVLLLNADTLPERDVVPALSDYLARHPKAALVGPRLLDPDGTAQPSCYPFLTPLNVLLVMTGLNGLIARIPPLASRFLPTKPLDRPREVPWLKGAALAIRRSAFVQVGGFDERFFMYGEEVDLAYRLSQAGWQSHFAPVANVVHRDGASTPEGRAAIELFVWRSLVRFYRLHYSRARRLQLRALSVPLMSARIARDGLKLVGERRAEHRRELRRNIDVWWRILRGGFEQPGPRTSGETATPRLDLPA